MTKTQTRLDPALVPLIEALARCMVEKQDRETAEAADEMAALRSALGLDDDFPAWKRKVEGIMKLFYREIPYDIRVSLRQRLALVRTAVEELGPAASHRAIVARVREHVETQSAPASRRRRRNRGERLG